MNEPAAAARLPADPAAFVREAERITNERSLDALPKLYAPEAVFTSVTDGVATQARGVEEVLRAWRVSFAFLDAREFSLVKRLLVAGDGVLVNEWTGSLAGRTHATGIEVWRFDTAGLIVEHTLYSFLNTRPESSVLQRLRLLVSYPLTALAFRRAQRQPMR